MNDLLENYAIDTIIRKIGMIKYALFVDLYYFDNCCIFKSMATRYLCSYVNISTG